MTNLMHRLLTVALVGGLFVAVLAGPALAHGRGSDASNYLSTITSAPQVEGVDFAIINSDEYLQVTNTGPEEIMIPGYLDEPYLRVGPDGVFRNRNSQATYVNADRFGNTPAPPGVDGTGEPDWEKISSGNSYAWHDHRVHWMAGANPPGVQTDPGTEQLMNNWMVPFMASGTTFEVTGDLTWVPGGNPLIWLIPALLVVSIPVAYGLLRTKPDKEAFQWPGLSTPAGVTLLVLAVANLLHLVDDLFATPIPISQTAVSAVQTAFFIAIAIFGAIRTIQGREGAFTALGVGAGAIFIGQGLLYLSVLSASQTASLFPGWLTRVVVAASVVQIVPMAVAAIMGTRALLPEWEDEELAREAAGPAPA
ncbi:MAG: hypothetical protein ACR2HR_02355 [Euzebya sp.]